MKAKSKVLRRISCLFTGFSLLTGLGCPLQQSLLMVKGAAPKELEQKGVTLSVRYLAEEELLTKHGQRAKNPFLSGDYLFSERQLVIFDLTIKNTMDKPIQLQAETISINFDSRSLKPVDLFNFESHWRLRDVVEKTSKKYSEFKQRLIREFVLPASMTVEPKTQRSGYIVFMTSELPEWDRRAQVLLSIPLLVLPSEQTFEFNFNYSF